MSVSARELARCIGLSEGSPDLRQACAGFGAVLVKAIDGRRLFHFQRAGVTLRLSPWSPEGRTVEGFTLHGGGVDGFARFGGTVVEGFDFDDSQQAVRAKLGAPARSEPPIGSDGPVDHFVFDFASLAVCCSPDAARVVRVEMGPR